MKNIIFLSLFTFCCLSGFSKKIHLIIVADTYDFELSDGVKKDIENIKAQFSPIENGLPTYQLNAQVFELNNRMNKSVILDYINQLSVSSSDIMIFYFSGHGSDFPPKFKITNSSKLDIDTIITAINNKEANLKLIVADCCATIKPARAKPKATIHDLIAKEKYQKRLSYLLNTRGTYTFLGVSSGEYGVTTPEGSYFTNSFINAINYSIENSEFPTWKEVFCAAKCETSKVVMREQEIDQNPTFQSDMAFGKVSCNCYE